MYNYFTPIPHYSTPTVIPFTYRDSWTLLEQLERLREYLIDLQKNHNELAENLSHLIDDANTAIDTALQSVRKLTADYQGLLDEMKVQLKSQLDEVNRIADRLSHALEIAEEANRNYSETLRLLNEQTVKLGELSRRLDGKLDEFSRDMDSKLAEKVGNDHFFLDPTVHGADPTGKTPSDKAFRDTLAELPDAVKGDFKGGTVYIPAGHYLFHEPLRLPSCVNVVGAGDSAMWKFYDRTTVLEYDGPGAFIIPGKTCRLQSMTISGPGVDGESVGVLANKTSQFEMEDCTLNNWETAYSVNENWYGHISDSCFIENGLAMNIDYSYNQVFRNLRIACYRNTNKDRGNGIKLFRASMCSFYGCSIEGFDVFAINCDGSITLNINGCYFETQGDVAPNRNAINLAREQGFASVNITGCQVYVTGIKSFVNITSSTSVNLCSTGNLFKGGNVSSNTHIYGFSPTTTNAGGFIAGDAWQGKQMPKNNSGMRYTSKHPENFVIQYPPFVNYGRDLWIGMKVEKA